MKQRSLYSCLKRFW